MGGDAMTRRSRPDTMLIREDDVDRTSRVERLGSSWSLPLEIVDASTRRVGVVAVAYAFTFFMAAFVPSLVDASLRAVLFSELYNWLPPAAAILTALLVAVAMRADIGRVTKVRIGILLQ